MLSASEIRQQFLDFFVDKCGHTAVPSSPVVPFDDDTLMFANAGMNQFKDVFLGTGTRPYRRAVDTQKCIRAGGKHNDLDDVGKDTYHHTFFEMLGNWSFGDFFKEDAIAWAWQLLTEVWKIDPDRLHATVFEGDQANNIPRDDEAAEIWTKKAGLPKERIHFCGKKDNFWMMGDSGPCGPCTEIHIDRTPRKSGGKLVNSGVPEVMEIWNLVFIQYNAAISDEGVRELRTWDAASPSDRAGYNYPDRDAILAKYRTFTPLPAKHVDTGMGFERIVAVLQKKDSNYDTDVFAPLFKAIQEITKAPKYGGSLKDLKDVSYRVIADHVRMLTFAITDGATPGNLGRGYVLRSVLRRALRYGWQYLEMKNPFLHKLVPDVIDQMAEAFPELNANPERVREIIFDEEKSFLKTLERGLKLFNESIADAKKAGGVIGARTAFDLHTEQGFFIDITEQMAAEAGLTVDRDGYEKLLVEFKDRSRQGIRKIGISAVQGTLPSTDDTAKFSGAPMEAEIIGWVKGYSIVTDGKLLAGDQVALLIDKTNFYGEQGGQVGDTGFLRTSEGAIFEVEDTQRLGDAILHLGELKEGRLRIGDKVQAEPSLSRRWDIMRNHTATHLMNLALRRTLGPGVDQKGSLVDGDKTRFDFSYDRPLTAEDIRKVEAEVNRRILDDLPVGERTAPLPEAKKLPGVRAVFGEKYPDPVRVVTIGRDPAKPGPDDSIEFCGGTHLPRTGNIGIFKIVSQEGISKGVRRVTAITGRGAQEHVDALANVANEMANKLNCRVEEIPARFEAVQQQIRELQQKVKKAAAGDLGATSDNLFDAAIRTGGSLIIVGEMPTAPEDALRVQLDALRQRAGSAVVVLGWKVDDANVGFLAAVTDDLVAKGVKAGDLIGKVAEVCGGKGGGRPNMARAGGKMPEKLDDALNRAIEWARDKIK